MDASYKYKVEDLTHELDAGEYIAHFRDVERFRKFCTTCTQYGKSWGCPPFDFDEEDYISGYDRALIVLTKITPEDPMIPFLEITRLILPERLRIERQLLDMEKKYGGRAFSYIGTCLHCSEALGCTRPLHQPCRHPDLVRPSLESFGFDIGKTTHELFGIDIKWRRGDFVPEYLLLVSGFFHNDQSAVW